MTDLEVALEMLKNRGISQINCHLEIFAGTKNEADEYWKQFTLLGFNAQLKSNDNHLFTIILPDIKIYT